MARVAAKKAKFTRTEEALQARQVKPLNEMQAVYLNCIKTKQVTFGIGPAGTGKTYVAASWAAGELASNRVSQIILTRPAVESGASLGFLPGTIEEKYEPYLLPFKEYLVGSLGKGAYECALKNEKIVPRPLNFLRGATFRDSIVLLDEAQNCTRAEMLMFLTRIGENCTVVVSGDIAQSDLFGECGLEDAIRRLELLPEVAVVEFEEEDIVRSGFVRKVIKAYRH